MSDEVLGLRGAARYIWVSIVIPPSDETCFGSGIIIIGEVGIYEVCDRGVVDDQRSGAQQKRMEDSRFVYLGLTCALGRLDVHKLYPCHFGPVNSSLVVGNVYALRLRSLR